MNSSEIQREWFYTVVGICIILLGIGWIILSRILWNSPFYAPLVGILVGSLAGLFLGRGKLKLFIPKLEKT